MYNEYVTRVHVHNVRENNENAKKMEKYQSIWRQLLFHARFSRLSYYTFLNVDADKYIFYTFN